MPPTQKRLLTPRPRAAQGGFALAFVMLLLMGLMALMLVGALGGGNGTNAFTSNGAQMASAHMDSTAALNLAESGADYARLWLTQQVAPPSNSRAFAPLTDTNGHAEWGAALTGGSPNRAVITYPDAQHTFSVTIYPSSANAGSTTKGYLIESIGVSQSARVVLHVVVQVTSFAKYAYFDDNDHPNPGHTNLWYYPMTFQGPYHSNNSNGQSMGFQWYDSDATTMFLANQRDSYSFSGMPTWLGSGTTANDFTHLTNGGLQNMTFGWQTNPNGSIKQDANGNPIPNSPRIPLPTTNYAPQYAALGQTVPNPATSAPPGVPNAAGATLSANGGIYIHVDTNPTTHQPDDVQTMAFSALPDAQGNKTIQQILITQPVARGSTVITQEQRITINPGADTTSLQTSTNGGSTWSATQTEAGTTNGVIYSDGNIGGQVNRGGAITGGVSGTIADNVVSGSGTITHYNSLSLTTDIANSKNIYIAGSLTYNTARNLALSESQDTNFLQKAGTMGLVASQIYIPNDVGTKVGNSVKLEIDSTLFAKNTFEDQNPGHHELGVSGNNSNLIVEGGLIEGNVAYMNLGGGYTEHYNYDTRMADYPPPYFPAVSNTYTVLSWQVVPTPLE